MMDPVDLSNVQGLVLRGYAMPLVRHLVLRVDAPAAGRRLLGQLAGAGQPELEMTSAAPWQDKPAHCVNVGITFDGLKALGVPAESLRSFPAEYAEGAAARAGAVGDTGQSAPEYWLPSLLGGDAHLVLTVFAQDPAALAAATAAAQAALRPGIAELSRHDGAALPDKRVHFGYTDGLSQPTIAGVPPAGIPDPLPLAPLGSFLTGYPSQNTGFTYPVPMPAELGREGSFGVFRIAAQDVAGFERYLQDAARSSGLPVELVAAKLCGRWRNGVPLVLSPDTDTPDPPIGAEQLNYFDYAGVDPNGHRCPIGAHVRRMHPRGERVAGNGGALHRLVRRGLPYGPAYDPAAPADGIERGLLGMFIGVSIRDQFEFVLAQWANDGQFTAGLGRSRDPLVGDHTRGDGSFIIQRPEDPLVLRGLSRFVTTRGSAYCFLPSRRALRYLGDLPPKQATPTPAAR